MTSVTQQLAEWIAGAGYDDLPEVGIRRVEERFIDSLGVQFAGMSVATGQIITEWVRAQGANAGEHRGGRRVQEHGVARHAGQRHGRTCPRVRRHRHVQRPLRQSR